MVPSNEETSFQPPFMVLFSDIIHFTYYNMVLCPTRYEPKSLALCYSSLYCSQPYLLCISTSKRVLRMPFDGQNQFFDAKTTFCILLSHNMYKIMQKINKNNVIKGVYQLLVLLFKAGWQPKAGRLLRKNNV